MELWRPEDLEISNLNWKISKVEFPFQEEFATSDGTPKTTLSSATSHDAYQHNNGRNLTRTFFERILSIYKELNGYFAYFSPG